MAISVVASASGALTADTTITLSTAFGTTPLANDIVLAIFARDDSMIAPTVLTSGYASLYAGEGTTGPSHAATWKRMGGTPDGTVSLDIATGKATAWQLHLVRGVDTTTAIDAIASEAQAAGNGQPDPPSLATVTNGALRVAIGWLDDRDVAASATAPATFDSIYASDAGVFDNASGASIFTAFRTEATAGTLDPGAFSSSQNDVWWAGHFAFRPAAGASPIAGATTATLAAVTASATAMVALKGSASATLAAVTSSATGRVAISGSASSPLAAATASAAGTLALTGAAGAVLGDATASGVGAITLVGAVAAALADVTVSAQGALAKLTKTSRGSDYDVVANALTVGAFTPADGALLVAAHFRFRSGTATPGSSLSGGGLTWTQRVSHLHASSLDWDPAVAIWTAPVGAGASMTVTATTSTAVHRHGLYVVEYGGAGGVGATGTAGFSGATGDLSITLSGTPAADSEVIAAILGRNWVGTASAVGIAANGTELHRKPSVSGDEVDELYTVVEAITGMSGASQVFWEDVDLNNSNSNQGTATVALEITAADTSGPITGVLAGTLDAVAATASGALALSGAASAALAAVTTSSSGAVSVTGALAEMLAAATTAATGALAITGAATVALDAVSGAAEGVIVDGPAGALSATLAPLTAAGAGGVAISGEAAVALADVTAEASGAIAVAGHLDAVLDDLTAVADGVLVSGPSGSVDATLDSVTASATGAVLITGSAGATLETMMVEASAQFGLGASAEITLDAVTIEAAGRLTISASAAIGLGPVLLVAANEPFRPADPSRTIAAEAESRAIAAEADSRVLAVSGGLRTVAATSASRGLSA